MTKINFINHSSLLIEDGEDIILTDPWFEKVAFGSWLPVPPTVFHPTYLLSLAYSNIDKFILVISHGHDDHCDDDYLSLFPNDIKVVIPKFSSVGLRKRVERAGFKNIIEVADQTLVNGVKFNTFTHMDVSHDDAIFSITTSDSYIIHSNDNWRFTEENIKEMKKESEGLPKLLATQIAIANGFPYLYEEYSKEEKVSLVNERLIHIMNVVYESAIKIGVDYFFPYAGHSMAYVKDNEELKELGGFKSFEFYKRNIQPKLFDKINFLEMLPGDMFNFTTQNITGIFHNKYTEDAIKKCSMLFYEKYKTYESADSYKYLTTKYSNYERIKALELFLEGFNNYVVGALERSGNYQSDILGSSIKVQDSSGNDVLVIIGKGVQKWWSKFGIKIPDADTNYTISNELLDALLQGNIIWENLEIGLQMKISKDKNYHNGHIMRWLSKYGYLYFNQQNKK